MSKRIILWQTERVLSTDGAGLTILSSLSPPNAYFQPGPYLDHPDNLPRVPSLSYFCIKQLVNTPELVYLYGVPRPYRVPSSPSDPDILQAIIPRNRQGHVDLAKLDPRLWAIIVQVYADLPQWLRIYRTALSDKYTPLLQHIPATEHFSLLTVLELPGCSHLNDDTIIHLAALHTLCALDMSSSTLTVQGVRRLSGTLKWVEDGVDTANQRRGPWQLRILSLRNCKRVTNAIFQYVEPFMLLSVLDLRGTLCTWNRQEIPPAFFPAVEKRLYYPTSPVEALSLLSSVQGLLPSRNLGFLHIDHLTHAARDNHGSRSDSGCSEGPITALLPHHEARYATDPSALPCPPERSLRPSSPSRPNEVSPMEAADPEATAMRIIDTVVAAESEAYAAQYKARMFYSHRTTSTGPSKADPPGKMPQWGQELLMLYRDSPPWSWAQLRPIAKTAPKSRSLEEVAAVKRTNERAKKGVQKMKDILAERHFSAKQNADTFCDHSKRQTRPFTPRNPFAVPFGEPSGHVQARSDERTSTPSHTDTDTKSVMNAPPKSLGSLKPISTLPVPIPPDSDPARPAPANNGRGAQFGRRAPRRSHESSLDGRPVSLRIQRDSCGQRVGIPVGSNTNKSRPVRADPAAENDRGRAGGSSTGSKKQKDGSGGGFDWSSWGAVRAGANWSGMTDRG